MTTLAHVTIPFRLAARAADVVYVTPRDTAQADAIVQEIRAEQAMVGRDGQPLHIFGDLVVFLDPAPGRKRRLDKLAGAEFGSDAFVFTGTPDELADLLASWRQAGLTGFRLRPGAIPHDLMAITRELVPALRRRGLFRTSYEANTLRGLLGLSHPVNRFSVLNGA